MATQWRVVATSGRTGDLIAVRYVRAATKLAALEIAKAVQGGKAAKCRWHASLYHPEHDLAFGQYIQAVKEQQ